MYTLQLSRMSLSVDFGVGQITSLMMSGKERLAASTPLFRVRLRNRQGIPTVVASCHAKACRLTQSGAIYTCFDTAESGPPLSSLTVEVQLVEKDGRAEWYVAIQPNHPDYFVEWIDFPLVTLPALKDHNTAGDGGSILLPYNEGVLVSDTTLRQTSGFGHTEPEYPSMGSYAIFPNMICSQMIAYLWDDIGLYIGAHDPDRAVKAIDFYDDRGGVTMQLRLFCGVDFGEAFATAYPIVWTAVDARWESAAELYRDWFASALPPRVQKLKENPNLPSWYEDAPLVVTYPVRGRHDMDDMSPNALYPYTNALPLLDELQKITQSRLLVLLMHWEGTAPWAPPYVWPPYGGVENFNAFKDALHGKNHMLGVYCSGFGYTLQSNLIGEYDCHADYEARGLERGMCAAPDGEIYISKICTAQRSGYDICPASPTGHALLAEAYTPLFESGIDYAQILDQNHGGGQYFCYGRDHGHPPAPGRWMTAHMQKMLSEWNEQAPGMLFGCESAAAEPFIGNLLLSDNRFELNYMFGTPVPLYAYLYHEYLRNFMGNQVCCPFRPEDDTLPYRLAYAFVAGDLMTLVLNPEGKIMSDWGQKNFEHLPNKNNALRLVANLTRFYRKEAKPYLHEGRMIPAPSVNCGGRAFKLMYFERSFTFPRVLSSAWECRDGSRALILVNPGEEDEICRVNGTEIKVAAMDARLVSLN
ncbi:MAG: hypothetical protein E7645_07190 [Ruminococcaceae bacterium]|nr:hypothetical protein [Oscillospiraceae bacterium]